MIVNDSESLLIDYLDWADKGSLWVCDVATLRIDTIKIQDARGMSIHAGRDGFFVVESRTSKVETEIAIRSVTNPRESLARMSIVDGKGAYHGDIALWSNVPKVYNWYLQRGDSVSSALLFLHPEEHSVEVQRMTWFDEGNYDFDRQGIGMVTEVPGAQVVLICVQRDSFPILYDPMQQKPIGKLSLAGGRGFVLGGNSHFYFRRTKSELWTDDRSVILRMDAQDWSVLDLIDVEHPGSFIGQFEFNRDETLCAVPRPFHGDVVAIDTATGRITHRAVVGRQPLRVALLSGGHVIARDWKTGDLLHAQLEHLPEGPSLSSLIASPEDLYEQIRLLASALRQEGEKDMSERLVTLVTNEPSFHQYGDIFVALGTLRENEIAERIGWRDRIEVMIAFATSNMKIEIVQPIS